MFFASRNVPLPTVSSGPPGQAGIEPGTDVGAAVRQANPLPAALPPPEVHWPAGVLAFLNVSLRKTSNADPIGRSFVTSQEASMHMATQSAITRRASTRGRPGLSTVRRGRLGAADARRAG